MDANGLKFWMLAEAHDWVLAGEQPALRYDRDRRSLRLTSQAAVLPPVEPDGTEAEATARLERVPQARDASGTRARWDAATGRIMATGALSGQVPIWTAPSAAEVPTDLCVGTDGVLYLAVNGGVTLVDLRDRWDAVSLSMPGFAAWRLAAAPDGGVWVLDRDQPQLARVTGLPLRRRVQVEYDPDTPRPCEENANPPRLQPYPHATFVATERPVGLACSPDGQVAVLCWQTDGAPAVVRYLDARGGWYEPCLLQGLAHPFSLAWVARDRLALLVAHLDNEAPVYPASPGAARVMPVGDYYPLRPDRFGGEPFMHGLTLPPHYATNDEEGSLPLHYLSLPSFASEGEASNQTSIDSGSARTVWHRLYLEANLPDVCGVRILLAAEDTGAAPTDNLEWHEHQFGSIFRVAGEQNIPVGAWVPHASEIPHHPGLLTCDRSPGNAGLFTALIQRPQRKVKTLRGRYLHVRIVLSGDRRTTPEVWAVRVYGSRFSYVENYLPELYQETVFGPEADATLVDGERSTPADFLERFVGNFEGVLTMLEDRVAAAHLLTAPATTPPEALEWLASWIGLALDSAYPEARHRRLLAAAPTLYRQRGTLAGLTLALDIATGDGVRDGRIIVIENWRFRRIVATILGANLADETNPLLAGMVVSGNSYVGDTLVLGDEDKKEFLALFAADLDVTAAEAEVIAALFDRLAYRVTILVHNDVQPQEQGLIQRIAALETPAHIITDVQTATGSLMVALRSLIGIDTYLSPKRPPGPLRLGTSQIGVRDLLQATPSLDPRLDQRI